MNTSEFTDYTKERSEYHGNQKQQSNISKGEAMIVLVSTDFGVWKYKERIYTKFAFSSILQRYGNCFGNVSLCCPVKNVSELPEESIDITDLVSSLINESRLKALFRVRNKELSKRICDCELVIGRFPGFISITTARIAREKKIPCFSEVVGCGWDSLWNHGFLGKMMAPYMFFGEKHALEKSDFALYVTEKFLQNRYPCDKLSVGVSNVVIPQMEQEVIEARKKKIAHLNPKTITLMTCAAVNVRYKGQQFVIRAIPQLNKMGIQIIYYCIGQGESTYLEKIAKNCGVEDQVVFTGTVSHDKIFEMLDECDIYMQPSLQEGLPRALVEAMSRGCPAIGARTGGIPELIPEECIVERKSVSEIVDRIVGMLDKGLGSFSEQNFERAKDFQEAVLDGKRNAYFEYVRQDILKRQAD